MKLQRDQRCNCAAIVSMVNSNENGTSMMDDYCRDVHEVEVGNMIDGGLEALLDLRNNEFEEEGMADDHNDNKCDENNHDYF